MEDEASFYRQPTAAWQWSPQGRRQPRMAYSARANQYFRVAVSLNPITGQLTHRIEKRFPAAALARAYRAIAQAYPQCQRLDLVMDNWPVHSHPRAWEAIAADARIHVLWLPTYAPWLNPAEKVWKWLRQQLTHMHAFADCFTDLRSKLERTLREAAQNPQAILRYTGTGNCKLYAS